MASNESLAIFTALSFEAGNATLDTRNGHPVIDFDPSTSEHAIFGCVMPKHYGGGGLTAYLHFGATGIVTGNVVWEASFERGGDGQQDMDSDGFASAKTVTVAVPGTDGNLKITSIAFLSSEIDGILVGEGFRIKIRRAATDAGDTAAADAELRFIEVRET